MSSPDAARAAKAAVSLQVLGLVGLAIDGAYWLTSHGRVLPGYLAASAVLGLLLVALIARRRPSVRLSAAAALVNVLVVLVALWSADEVLAREPHPWVPFLPHKLGVLTLALIAPTPTWVGVTCIAAFTLAPVAHYLALPAAVRDHLALGEPWASLAFGAFALVALVHRVRLLRFEREVTRARERAAWLERLASLGLAIRDLSNTPLQTLRLSTAMLRQRHPEEAPRLDRMDRALDRLEQLERTLSQHEIEAPCRPAAASFDALAVLESAREPALVLLSRSRGRGHRTHRPGRHRPARGLGAEPERR